MNSLKLAMPAPHPAHFPRKPVVKVFQHTTGYEASCVHKGKPRIGTLLGPNTEDLVFLESSGFFILFILHDDLAAMAPYGP